MLESWVVVLISIWNNGMATSLPLPPPVVVTHLKSETQCNELGKQLVRSSEDSIKKTFPNIESVSFDCFELSRKKSI